MDIDDLIKEGILTLTYIPAQYGHTTYLLTGTIFILFVEYDGNGKHWGMRKEHNWHLPISFEKVFSSIPDSLKEKMIYHLDLFQ